MNERVARGHTSLTQGKIGQKLFSLWATEAKAVANPSQEDEAGWDFLVDLPPPSRGGVAVTFKVQVKTLSPGEESAAITLSNWRRMLTDVVPWFIVLIQLKEGTSSEFKAIHLMSADGDTLRDVVSELAKPMGRKGKINTALNHRTYAATLRRSEKIDDPAPALLFEAIRSRIGDSIEYVKAKASVLAEATRAHPEGHGKIKFAFSTTSELQGAFAEFAVGLRTELPFSSAHLVDRFLGEERSNAHHGEGTLRMDKLPSMGKSTIAIQSGTTRDEVALDTHSSHRIFPSLPPEAGLCILRTPFSRSCSSPISLPFALRSTCHIRARW